jgi:osmotically-inducible protein OsmY
LIPYYPIVPISEIDAVSDQVVTVDLAEKELDSFARYRSRDGDDIRAELRDRLAKQGFDLDLIQIDVDGSIVKLRGWVPSISAKRHAEAVVRAVEGVIDVEDLLDTDIAIQTRVAHALLSDPRTSISVIEVVNERGVVTLKGEVDSAEVREVAEEIAKEQPGVLSVVNALEVKPDEYTEWFAARTFALGLWSRKKDQPRG